METSYTPPPLPRETVYRPPWSYYVPAMPWQRVPNTPPILALGMHRSGTSLVMRVVRRLGVFAGTVLDENDESRFFIYLNDRILRLAGTTWVDPRPATTIHQGDLRERARADIRRHLATQLYARMYGAGEARRAPAWGWKDPRNTLTWPVWLAEFPQARLIFVHRHGVDVAASHRVRDGFDLSAGFRMWELYNEVHRSRMTSLGTSAPPVLDVHYEHFLREPHQAVDQIADFLDLGTDREEAHDFVAKKARPERAYAFLRRPELAQFAQRVGDSPTLAALGYSAAGDA